MINRYIVINCTISFCTQTFNLCSCVSSLNWVKSDVQYVGAYYVEVLIVYNIYTCFVQTLK